MRAWIGIFSAIKFEWTVEIRTDFNDVCFSEGLNISLAIRFEWASAIGIGFW